MRIIIFVTILLESIVILSKTALIFGAGGQDGIYLSSFLLSKGYFVHGVVRRPAGENIKNINKIIKSNINYRDQFHLHFCDLIDGPSVYRLIHDIGPDEIYNLAAQSDVKASFDNPESTFAINALGVLKILEGIRQSPRFKAIRFYQASTSEMFGKTNESPQKESTSFYPRSPYGVAKLCAHWMVINYRDTYGLYACSGILFNHESPLRGDNFVTKKIVKGVVKIANGCFDPIVLGNIDARRDWGHAKDYVEAMWLILQQPMPDDFVISTGCLHTVREFVEESFACVGIRISWKGSGYNEAGFDDATGSILVKIDKDLFRPLEPYALVGDSAKAFDKLNWAPRNTFKDIVRIMIEYELAHVDL